MKTMKPFLFICLSSWYCLSCGQDKTQHTPTESATNDTLTTFILPAIPHILTTPELRAQYLASHYWDLINLADTNYIHHPEITEQGWVNFIDLLKLVPSEEAAAALKGIIQQASVEKKCLLYFMQLAEKYLFEPNSPMRNETYYQSILQALLASSQLTDTEKLRSEDQLKTILLNQVGTPANDFCYTLVSGQQESLHKLNAPYTLLFFSDPQCHACVEAIGQMKQLNHIQQAINQKKLTVLSVYPDEDIEGWKSNLDRYPKNWIHAYDKKQVIKEKNLYDLRAIPCLYLLDKNKKVILKDVTPETIDTWLSTQP